MCFESPDRYTEFLKNLKHMTGIDGLYEIRITVRSDIYRIFCCFDKGDLVILIQCFSEENTENT